MTTIKEIKSWGYNRGYNIVKSIDLVDIGDYGDGQFLDERENVKITSNNWLEFHTNIAYEYESGNREFSPFEFLAHDINEYEDKKDSHGDAWLEFDEAIVRGINRALCERWKSIRMTKKDYARGFDGSFDLFNAVWRKFLAYQSATGEPDINENIEVERLLEEFASELVNDSSSRFYIHG